MTLMSQLNTQYAGLSTPPGPAGASPATAPPPPTAESYDGDGPRRGVSKSPGSNSGCTSGGTSGCTSGGGTSVDFDGDSMSATSATSEFDLLYPPLGRSGSYGIGAFEGGHSGGSRRSHKNVLRRAIRRSMDASGSGTGTGEVEAPGWGGGRYGYGAMSQSSIPGYWEDSSMEDFTFTETETEEDEPVGAFGGGSQGSASSFDLSSAVNAKPFMPKTRSRASSISSQGDGGDGGWQSSSGWSSSTLSRSNSSSGDDARSSSPVVLDHPGLAQAMEEGLNKQLSSHDHQ